MTEIAYDQTLVLHVNAFSEHEAAFRVLDQAGDLDFSGKDRFLVDEDEEIPAATPANVGGTPGAQGTEVVVTRRAYLSELGNAHSADYFIESVLGGLPLWEKPGLRDTPAIEAYRSSIEREAVLKAALPQAVPQTEAERFLACGQALTEKYGLNWVCVHQVFWTWDRRETALHCKSLAAMSEGSTRQESIQKLGEIAYATTVDPLTASSIDRQCVPLLQAAWQELEAQWAGLTPKATGPKPRF